MTATLCSDTSVRLSFDDGPGPSTPALLDVLRAASCQVTFFLLGRNLAQALDVAVRMVHEGHVLGNHCYSHARPDALPDAALIEEIAATDALIRRVYRMAGQPEPAEIPLRLPYGADLEDGRLGVLLRLGRIHTAWTAIVDDWRRPPPSPLELAEAMRQHIASRMSGGSGVLLCLHDSSRHCEAHPATVAAVQLLLSRPGWQTGQ
jgi:chitin deacetylase